MTRCPRCGKQNVDPIYPHTCTPLALRLADGLLDSMNDEHWNQLHADAAAELRRLHAETEALRAALAEQPAEQAPVAWVYDCERELPPSEAFSWCETAIHKTPLYTAPQPAKPAEQEPIGWYVTGCSRLLDEYDAKAEAKRIGGTAQARPVYTAPQPAKRVPLTPRELELIDGMIEVQLVHAERCDAIANRRIAPKQKEWDMERVELLRKIRAHGITGEQN